MKRISFNKDSKKFHIDWVGLIIPVILFVVWSLVVKFGSIPTYKMPSPIKLGRVCLDFICGIYQENSYSGKLMENLWASLCRVCIGFFIAAFCGITLGFCSGRVRIIKRLVDPMINAIKAIPGIGWLPISIVWFGIGEKNTIFLMALAAFFPIYINTQEGASNISPLLIRAGHMLGANRFKLFTTIIFPAAFPNVLVGLRTGMGVTWAYLVLGEITGVTKGLGAIMSDARMLGHVDMILVTMVIIAICGKLTDFLLVRVCSMFYPLNGRGRISE
nr:ABC transporter permease [uncultured Cellulosilyticum sp.]